MVDEGCAQDQVAEHYRINQSQVSRWVKNRQNIMNDAASKHRKGKKPKKYLEQYKLLWIKFKDGRSKGHRVNFHWLRSRARNIHKEMVGDDGVQIKSQSSHTLLS